MKFNQKETTTILAALRYLQANRDDAIEAMADLNDNDEPNDPNFLLSAEEIDTLCENINLES